MFVEGLLRLRIEDDEMLSRFSSLLTELAACEQSRNRLVHSYWHEVTYITKTSQERRVHRIKVGIKRGKCHYIPPDPKCKSTEIDEVVTEIKKVEQAVTRIRVELQVKLCVAK